MQQPTGRGAARPPIGIAFDGDVGNRIDAVLAIAMLNLTAEIPALLERFGAGSGSRGSGLGSLVSTAIKVAFLLA